MATFFEQLKDGIANALGIQNHNNQSIKTIPFGKGVVIPKLKSLPRVTAGKNRNKGQVAIDVKQDKGIAQTQTNLQTLSKQIASLKKQDVEQKRLLANLQRQLHRNKISQRQYYQMSRTIANNKRTIKHYKNMLYKQKNWVRKQMQSWKRANSSRINNQSINLQKQMMKQQMRLLETIAKQRFTPQRSVVKTSVQKKRTSYSPGNKYSKELLKLRRELKRSQALLRAKSKYKSRMPKPIRPIRRTKFGRISTSLNRNRWRHKLRPTVNPIRRTKFRRISTSLNRNRWRHKLRPTVNPIRRTGRGTVAMKAISMQSYRIRKRTRPFKMGRTIVARSVFNPRAVKATVAPVRRKKSNLARIIRRGAFGFPIFPTRKNIRTAGRFIKRNKKTALRFALGIPIPTRKTIRRIGRSVKRGWRRFKSWFRR